MKNSLVSDTVGVLGLLLASLLVGTLGRALGTLGSALDRLADVVDGIVHSVLDILDETVGVGVGVGRHGD